MYLGYQYLEARPESWLEDKQGELRLAFKAHATVRPHKDRLYCGGALLEAMRSGQSLNLKALGLETKLRLVLVTGEVRVSAPDQPCLPGETGIVSGRGECIPDASRAREPVGFPLFASEAQSPQCTVDGRSVPLTASSLKRQHNSQPEPTAAGCTPLRTT